MKKGISKEMEIREVMKWQLLIAGAVDAAIKGTESYIRHMELTHQQGERSPANKSQALNREKFERGRRVQKTKPAKGGILQTM